jgi:hypothetical protein
MSSLHSAIFSFVFLLAVLLSSFVSAQESPLHNSKVLAVVPVSNGTIDKEVYRQFDRLVPELKKVSKDNIIKLECRYSGQPDREQDVLNAYQLAGRIEKYLRERHRLALDLWITISLGQKKSKNSPVLTIAVFADDIKRLDAIPVDPKKK